MVTTERRVPVAGRRRLDRGPARAAVLVRDQAAVRLERPRAAHQGPGRLDHRAPRRPTARPPTSCRPSRSSRRARRSRWSGPIKGLVTGRYEWIGFTSVNAVRAVREKFEEFGLDARAFAGLKIAAVGGVTAAGAARVGPRARPRARPASSPRSGPARATGRRSTRSSTRSTGSSCRAPTSPPTPSSPACRTWAGRSTTSRPTAPCGPPRRPRRCATRSRAAQFDAVRLHLELDGAQPRRHRRQAAPLDGRRLHRPGHGQDGRGARPAGRRPRARGLGRGARRRPRRPRRWASRSRRRRPASRCVRPSAKRPSSRPPTGHAERRVPACPTRSCARGGCARAPALRRLVAETRLHPAELVLPVFVREGADRAGADLRRCPASCSTPWTRSWRGAAQAVDGRARRDHALRRADDQGRAWAPAPTTPTASSTSRCAPVARGRRRRPRRDGRPVPRRVHRPRPLRRPRRARRGRQRRHPRALRRDGAGPGRAPAPTCVGPVRDDGRPGRRTSATALDAAGLHRHGRSSRTPRSTPRASTARSARPSSPRCVGDRATYQQDPANATEVAARDRARHRRGRRHRHGQAGRCRTSTSSRRGGRDVAGARGGLPDLGGVLA